MCIPNEVPVFTKDDILKDPNRFEKGDKATPIGWLHRLFLPEDTITQNDMNDCHKAKAELMKVANVKDEFKLLDWEDKATPTVASRALNKCLRNMGYKEIRDG